MPEAICERDTCLHGITFHHAPNPLGYGTLAICSECDCMAFVHDEKEYLFVADNDFETE